MECASAPLHVAWLTRKEGRVAVRFYRVLGFRVFCTKAYRVRGLEGLKVKDKNAPAKKAG